jgi:hypothetical protein
VRAHLWQVQREVSCCFRPILGGMGYWRRELEAARQTEKRPTFRDSWNFVVFVNLCLGVFHLIEGREYTFVDFLYGLAITFPLCHLGFLGLYKWLVRESGSQRPPPAAGSPSARPRE